MRSYRNRMVPKSNITSVTKRKQILGHRNTDAQSGESLMKTDSLERCIYKTRVTEDCWHLPEAKRSHGLNSLSDPFKSN